MLFEEHNYGEKKEKKKENNIFLKMPLLTLTDKVWEEIQTSVSWITLFQIQH